MLISPIVRQIAFPTLFYTVVLLAVLSLAGSINGQKPNCSRLLDELKAAQDQWSKAESNWRQAADRMANAQRRVADINSQLSKMYGDLTRAELDLESAQALAQDCARAQSDPKLAPLTDCSKVPERVRSASEKVARLRADYQTLQQELKELEKQVEKLEDANAAAHAEERTAAAALENARLAYAKCGQFWVGRITRRRYAANTSQSTKTGVVAGVEQTNTELKRFSSEEVIEIDILPDPPLPGILNPEALVSRRYQTSEFFRATSNANMRCRVPPPTHWQRISNEITNEKNEKGSGRSKIPVYIPPLNSGKYRIELGAPEITYRIDRSSIRTNADCAGKSPDTVTSSTAEGKLSPASFIIEGTVNPKTPDVLKGTISDGGDPARGGEVTLTWELRLVKPKK
ncbi:MAG: hypothetical protein K1X36_15445 [Pyrinomonadaceae bacterium]|nr:hypothetical protein [Pyrinomonadaceae bacterium]